MSATLAGVGTLVTSAVPRAEALGLGFCDVFGSTGALVISTFPHDV